MTTPKAFGFSDAELAARPTAYRGDLFAGKTVIVSGGGTGLGKAIAWLFGRLGANIAICGRKPEKLDAALAPMRAAGLTAEAWPCNIRRPEEVEAFLDAVAARFGGFDMLINNAGGQFPQPSIDFAPKGWLAVIETNLSGTWFMMQGAAKRWRDRGVPGSIVNIVTVTDRGMPGVAHTCAARAGVIALSKTVAVEWAPLGIRINCVAPGSIETDGMNVYTEEARQGFLKSNPMLHMGDAFDVAEACVYLGGDSGKFITGETLTVDGGGKLWGDFWAAGEPDYFRQARSRGGDDHGA